MPTLPIPFTPVDKSIDTTTAAEWNQAAYDGYWQAYNSPDGPKYAWSKRPGLTSVADLHSGLYGFELGRVDGLFYWHRQNIVITVDGGRVRYFDVNNSVTEDFYSTVIMDINQKPSFADVNGTDLYVASGGRIGEFTPASGEGQSFFFAYLTDADAPTSVKAVATINKTLVALRADSERFDWADSGDPTSWSGNYMSAEAESDLAQTMVTANNYLYLLGTNTTQVVRDDGTTFVNEINGALPVGISAPDSVCVIDGLLYWLSDTRDIVRLDGFTVTKLSNPAMTRYLRSLNSVAGARGFYLPYGDKNFYVLSVPSEDITLVYDIDMHQFYNWSFWNEAVASRQAWRGICSTYAEPWNKVFVGDGNTGNVYELSGETDNGEPIVSTLRTDHVDRGDTGIEKFCHELKLVFKRGGTNTTPKKMWVKWADNGVQEWSTPVEIELEEQHQDLVIGSVSMLGSYYTRQWEFTFPDDTQAAMISATERFSYGS